MKGRLAVLLGAAALAGVYAAGSWGSDVRGGPRSASFVSLWMPAGARNVRVERFSLRSGDPLARLATQSGSWAEVSGPYLDGGGGLWITRSSGPRCKPAGFGECFPVPRSCRSSTVQLDPGTDATRSVASFPHSELVTAVIPSPRGQLMVLRVAPCTRSYFNDHFVVVNRRTHWRWAIGADAAVCHGLSDASWNAAGTRLAFAYAPSRLKPGQQYPGEAGGNSCRVPLAAGIVIVSAEHASTTRSWHFIHPRHGCSYESVAFDDKGVVAFEACSLHRPGQDYSAGPADVVQLSGTRRVLFRLAVKPGASPGTVASDPETGLVLVSEDQAKPNHATPNWVWQLQGRRLRLIAGYPFAQTEFAAEPFSATPR